MKKIVYVVFDENTAYGETTHNISVFETKEKAMESFNAIAKRVREVSHAENLVLGERECLVEAHLDGEYNTNHCFVTITENELN